jgi:hydrogenase maturation protein HypF
MLDTGFRAPWTSSMGRLFDAVAALVGLRLRVGFEGEAAMALEWAVDEAKRGAYRLDLTEGVDLIELDWRPALEALLAERRIGVPVGTLAARFHNGLVDAVVEVAERVGEERVALTGGCFQNRVLAERAAARLEGRGFRPLLHRQVPANDGGLALGQVAVASARLSGGHGKGG